MAYSTCTMLGTGLNPDYWLNTGVKMFWGFFFLDKVLETLLCFDWCLCPHWGDSPSLLWAPLSAGQKGTCKAGSAGTSLISIRVWADFCTTSMFNFLPLVIACSADQCIDEGGEVSQLRIQRLSGGDSLPIHTACPCIKSLFFFSLNPLAKQKKRSLYKLLNPNSYKNRRAVYSNENRFSGERGFPLTRTGSEGKSPYQDTKLYQTDRDCCI